MNDAITITLRNVGFATVFNDRKAYLIMKNTTTGTEHSLLINTDLRLWQSGTTVTLTQVLNAVVPDGTYSLHLNLPDKTLTNAKFSIRCANTGLWDSVKGYNNLNQTYTKTTTVTPPPVEPPPVIPPPVLPVTITLVNNRTIVVANLPTSQTFTIGVYTLTGVLKARSTDIKNLKAGTYNVKVISAGITYTQQIKKI